MKRKHTKLSVSSTQPAATNTSAPKEVTSSHDELPATNSLEVEESTKNSPEKLRFKDILSSLNTPQLCAVLTVWLTMVSGAFLLGSKAQTSLSTIELARAETRIVGITKELELLKLQSEREKGRYEGEVDGIKKSDAIQLLIASKESKDKLAAKEGEYRKLQDAARNSAFVDSMKVQGLQLQLQASQENAESERKRLAAAIEEAKAALAKAQVDFSIPVALQKIKIAEAEHAIKALEEEALKFKRESEIKIADVGRKLKNAEDDAKHRSEEYEVKLKTTEGDLVAVRESLERQKKDFETLRVDYIAKVDSLNQVTSENQSLKERISNLQKELDKTKVITAGPGNVVLPPQNSLKTKEAEQAPQQSVVK